MEECCDICGDIGDTDAIISCSQCKINCEHLYCMKKPLEKGWRCKECEPISKPKPLPSSLPQGASTLTNYAQIKKRTTETPPKRTKSLSGSRKNTTHWEKRVATEKTKYICVNEAIKLSSGEMKPFAPLKVGSHPKSPQPKRRLNICERTPKRIKTEPMKFSSQGLGNIDISKVKPQQSKQFTESQRLSSSLQPSQAHVNKHVHNEKLAEVKLPQVHEKLAEVKLPQVHEKLAEVKLPQVHKEQLTEVKSPRTKAKSLMKNPTSDIPPVTISGGNKCTTMEVEACNAENVNNNFLPHSRALWMGNFSIEDDLTRNYQIQALPPSQVRKKVYDFSKQMPTALHFQLVPLKELWINLFQDYFPDRRDIGLYFIPSDSVRCEDYFSLLESISMKNFALKKQIDDVELVVFTSKLLSPDCQRLRGKYFLWGVFHRVRRDMDTRVFEMTVQSSQVEESEDVDMDIDMIGGVNVGRIDVPVQREQPPLPEKRVRLNGGKSKAVNLGFKTRY